nr:unnamed protein product [Spirometra erinaceieuropaei]
MQRQLLPRSPLLSPCRKLHDDNHPRYRDHTTDTPPPSTFVIVRPARTPASITAASIADTTIPRTSPTVGTTPDVPPSTATITITTTIINIPTSGDVDSVLTCSHCDRTFTSRISLPLRAKYTDFELVKVIGQGGFGRVQLVREKNTRRVYAMKMMSKQHLLDHSQSGYWEERDIMVKADSEWLVACHQAFVDRENIYLCMEYMPGGDLYYWLEHYDTFTEEQARFYLAETVLALEALHGLGYIHRDLKPDNMLLDAMGHLKLADFGSCVRMDANGTYFCTSPIGTPDYISPEMLNCQSKAGYIGPECDWWALGVIAYEMLFGETAFYGQSLVETYSRILGHEKSLKIPTDTEITPEFEQLIRDFLRPASVRLGCTSKVPGELGGAAAVKHHKFFANIDWSILRNSLPPIQPVVTSDVDTSNINFDESELTTSKFGNGPGNGNGPTNLPRSVGAFAPKKAPAPAYFTGENLAFAGFTFNRDASYVKPQMEEAAVDREEMAAALAEAKSQLQAAERQATIDQIAIKEAQDRLNDANAELSEVSQDRAQMKTVNEELTVQLTALESERDALVDRVNRLQQQLTCMNENLETERKNSACIREEFTAFGRENADLKAKIAILVSANSEAEVKPPTPAKEEDQRQRSGNGEVPEAELTNLKEALEEARRQNSRITAEMSSARRLHAEEIGDLSDQLQVSKHFADLYKSQLAEAEEALSLARKKEETLLRDISVYKANLETATAARLESKDKIFKLESSLAVAQAESSSMRKNFEAQLKEALSQVTRHRQLAATRLIDLETITNQRAELMEHCKSLEANVSAQTAQLQSLRDENARQKTRLDQAVIKLAEVAAGLPTVTGKKKTTSDSAKVSQLQKQLRNAEHNHHKEVIGLQSTIDRLKTDNSEKAQAVAELTETKHKLEAELAKAQSQINELYDWLDVKPGGRRGMVPAGNDNATGPAVSQRVVDTSARSSPSGTMSLQEISPMSLSLESLQSLQQERTTTMRPLLQLPSQVEGVCDFPERCRGRHKLAWTPKYVVICPFTISFYGSKEQTGTAPCDEIHIGKIFSVRPGTVLDLNYATPDDVSRLICIVSDEMTALDGSGGDGSDVTLSNRMPFTPNTTLNATSVLPGGAVGTASGNISWHGHSFQPMTFRILNTMCEVCRRPCSDLLSPPPALECVRCRMRIHRHHVEHHEKFVVCPKTVKQWLIRAPDPAARKEWISRIKQLQERYIEIQRGTDSVISPSSLSATPFAKFSRPLSSSTRYSSMRNFGHLSSNRETPSRRSIATPTTLPRTVSNNSYPTSTIAQPPHVIPPATNPSSNRPERWTALVAREPARYKVDIAALSEIRSSEQGQLEEVVAGYTFWSGGPTAERRDVGIAFATRNDVVGQLPCLPQAINDRLMSLHLSPGGGKCCLSLVTLTATSAQTTLPGEECGVLTFSTASMTMACSSFKPAQNTASS